MDASPQTTPAANSGRSATNPATLFLILGAAFVTTFMLIRTFTARTAAGRAADYSWKVTDLDGKPVDLATYRNRPVFLNVWATWCGPCVTEMPSIGRLSLHPKLKDVAFLCVSTDDSIEPVRSFFSGAKPPMTVLHSPGEIPPVFDSGVFPTTYFIAPGGRIARVETGALNWDSPEWVAILDTLDGKSG